jgi:ribonuclease P protein component
VETNAPNTLPKKERLCGKKGIERLLAKGRHGSVGNIRFIYAADNGQETNRLLVSVPKKLFKRAVKRNLLKRRIRESWRRLKHGLQTEKHMDVLIIYSTKEVLTYQEIYECIERVIERLNGTQKSNEKSE